MLDHLSSCAKHNPPAFYEMPCTCGAEEIESLAKKIRLNDNVLNEKVNEKHWEDLEPAERGLYRCDASKAVYEYTKLATNSTLFLV